MSLITKWYSLQLQALGHWDNISAKSAGFCLNNSSSYAPVLKIKLFQMSHSHLGNFTNNLKINCFISESWFMQSGCEVVNERVCVHNKCHDCCNVYFCTQVSTSPHHGLLSWQQTFAFHSALSSPNSYNLGSILFDIQLVECRWL